MKQLPDSSVDCIITDPPYNLGQFMHDRNTNLVKMRANQFAYAGWDNLNLVTYSLGLLRYTYADVALKVLLRLMACPDFVDASP